MKNIIVIGANGQLGMCLQDVQVNYNSYNFVFKNSSELDITNSETLYNTFLNSDFDYCINCAAYTAVDKAESNIIKATNVNELGIKNLAHICRENNVVLIHISTDFVFDGESNKPYTESDKTNPLSVYGVTKLKGEQTIQKALEKYFIIRTSWLYSEYGNNFLKTMLRLSKERTHLSVVGDQIGSPTYAKDLATAILSIIDSQSTAYGIYHYSNEGEISWYDFAKEIFKQSQCNIEISKIKTEHYPTPAKRPKYSVLNTSKIKRAFKINTPNWEQSLTKAILNLHAK